MNQEAVTATPRTNELWCKLMDALRLSGVAPARADRVFDYMDEFRSLERDLTAAREALEAKERECIAANFAGARHLAKLDAAEQRAATAEAALAGVREERYTLADALWGCWIDGSTFMGYECGCCERPIEISKWTTAEHEPDCAVLIAKRIANPPASYGKGA